MWACVLATGGRFPTRRQVGGVSVMSLADPVVFCDTAPALGAGHLLVLASPAFADEAHLAVTLLAGRHPELHTALRVSPHAPLAQFVAASAALGTARDPASGVALADTLLAGSWSGAQVRSVAGLAEPAPGLGQHLRSLLPGASFVVRNHPDPAVLPARSGGGVTRTATPRTLFVEEGHPGGGLVERLHQQAGAVAVRQFALPGDWHPVYRGRAHQFALVPAQAPAPSRSASLACPGCGLALGTRICPFCRVAGQPATGPLATISTRTGGSV